MFIIDAHLDLSLNALEFNRDLREPVAHIREREKGMTDKPDRANNTVSLPELRKGKIGIVVATQIARFVEKGSSMPGWNSPHQAWAQTQGQLAWYKAMEDAGEMTQISNLQELEDHLLLWLGNSKFDDKKPIGYILSLEGADSLVELNYLEKAYAYGLRALGPAHYGPGRYSPGTGLTGPMTTKGIELVKEMDKLNMILDITHLPDEAFDQALTLFKGTVWASHHNCRAIAPHQRQLSDDQINRLIERGAVIGGALDAWMMVPDYIRGKSDPLTLKANLEKLIDHYDHICQLAGNSNHVAIGSDLDGMFGREQSPYDLDTIADMQNLQGLLRKRGYSTQDMENIFHGNWLKLFRRAWA